MTKWHLFRSVLRSVLHIIVEYIGLRSIVYLIRTRNWNSDNYYMEMMRLEIIQTSAKLYGAVMVHCKQAPRQQDPPLVAGMSPTERNDKLAEAHDMMWKTSMPPIDKELTQNVINVDNMTKLGACGPHPSYKYVVIVLEEEQGAPVLKLVPVPDSLVSINFTEVVGNQICVFNDWDGRCTTLSYLLDREESEIICDTTQASPLYLKLLDAIMIVWKRQRHAEKPSTCECDMAYMMRLKHYRDKLLWHLSRGRGMTSVVTHRFVSFWIDIKMEMPRPYHSSVLEFFKDFSRCPCGIDIKRSLGKLYETVQVAGMSAKEIKDVIQTWTVSSSSEKPAPEDAAEDLCRDALAKLRGAIERRYIVYKSTVMFKKESSLELHALISKRIHPISGHLVMHHGKIANIRDTMKQMGMQSGDFVHFIPSHVAESIHLSVTGQTGHAELARNPIRLKGKQIMIFFPPIPSPYFPHVIGRKYMHMENIVGWRSVRVTSVKNDMTVTVMFVEGECTPVTIEGVTLEPPNSNNRTGNEWLLEF